MMPDITECEYVGMSFSHGQTYHSTILAPLRNIDNNSFVTNFLVLLIDIRINLQVCKSRLFVISVAPMQIAGKYLETNS